ncbi:class I lanthipeptide [Pedobacter montanisoli]|uniref:Class I lanthipeptide n=1 Tax=Pedobacter montanisoli TaxID=2923277 RepID=A0ABS9ZZS3_9SPHI|nr:class I lanthipeptide [Pedobacter montanisoli]MCJ0743815.1 class I lanthipeptide [Pedobacter montanisoli]
MKKINLDSKKLSLKKEKIASLTKDQMNRIVGGVHYTDFCDPRGCTDPDEDTIPRDTNSCPIEVSMGTCEGKCGLSDWEPCESVSFNVGCTFG